LSFAFWFHVGVAFGSLTCRSGLCLLYSEVPGNEWFKLRFV